MLGGFGIGTTEFVMMGILPDIANSLGITIPQAGHLISAYALGVVVGAPSLVMLSHRFAPKTILMALMLMFTLFNGLCIFAPNYESLLVFRFLSGLPHGAFFGVGAVVAARLADEGKAAQAVSMMFFGLTIANLLSVPLGTYLGHEWSWRLAFVLVAIVGLFAWLFVRWWMPALPMDNPHSLRTQISRFFRSRDAWLIMLATAIGTGGCFCWMSYIAPLLTDVSGFDASSVPYIMALAGAGMCVGTIIGGRMADRYSPALTTGALLLAMAVALILVYLLAGSQIGMLIMTFITGALVMAVAPPIQMLMLQSAKGAETLASSVLQACFNIGNALGAFLGGLPLVAGYDFRSPQLVGLAMALFGVLAIGVLMNGWRNRVSSELEAY
ncbi:MFS transporter AraJ [Formosimonas limnophila]|uniref:MFS transporter AraJ n=2 Tax=Formosimonas limnophila TaxID=1384487 RepID=A0A8J3FZ57_9BURK|nr:MFS transporter AraJ [Formosimonas limnophila]